jgi:hypothetical protein
MPNLLASRRSVRLGGAALAASAAKAGHVRARTSAAPSGLELVATFTEPRQVTCVAVGRDGRKFINFPRREEDVPVSVAEVGSDRRLTPYPDAAWNAYGVTRTQLFRFQPTW